MDKLFIPEKIKVGYDEREGTYTGKLAYVIYYDSNGKLRKQASWESWRDHKLETHDFNNEPTSGFVLNKGVGGQRERYSYNARNEYIRVYDPRGFEIEISVANLLFILRECDCSRGKGLEGKFVYAWNGTELALLPENSEDYQASKKFTILQGQKVFAKSLVPGLHYLTKKEEELVYIGKYDCHNSYCEIEINTHRRHEGEKLVTTWKRRSNDHRWWTHQELKGKPAIEKRHIFWDIENKCFLFPVSIGFLGEALPDSVNNAEHAELTEAYYKSPFGSKIVELIFKKSKKGDYFARKEKDNMFTVYGNHNSKTRSYYNISLSDEGFLITEHIYTRENHSWSSYNRYFYSSGREESSVTSTGESLWARLESGAEYLVDRGHLQRPNPKKDTEAEDE